MTDQTTPDPQDLDPRQTESVENGIEDVLAEAIVEEPTPVDPESEDLGTEDLGTEDLGTEDLGTEDLGAGAFDTPAADEATDPASDESAAPGDERDPEKAYLGRPELTPLYAMAGLADLAAAAVREIANEQIAAYRSRKVKGEEAVEDLTEKVSDTAKESNAQFNEFLAKAQQRTQELFEQAVAQYEHLADRGRVAVGDVLEAAKQQQKVREAEENGEAGSASDASTPNSDDSPQT